MQKRSLAVMTALSLCAAALAQAPFIDGALKPTPVRAAEPQRLAVDVPALAVELPATVEPLEPSSLCGGREIGYYEPAPADVMQAPSAGGWLEDAEGNRVMRLEFTSPNARGLRLELTPFDGMELWVYDPATLAVHGPYDSTHLTEEGTFWTTAIFGDAIGLEFRVAPGTEPPAALPVILSVAYFYEDVVLRDDPPFGTCDPDISCYGTWDGSIEDVAVGLMLFNCSGGSCGQCTGALLNRSGSDFAPIFMTARHCISTQASASTLIVFWNYKTDSCNGTAPDRNSQPRNDGAQLLKTVQDSEWTLLGLWQPSRVSAFLGWDANALSNGSSVTGVHHASGQPKRICFGTKTGDTSCLGAPNEWRVDYSTGRTIPGASGSPVYDSSRRVRGTLSCDNRECPPDAVSTYGRFDTAFSRLDSYIYQMANPNYASGAVAGDPGNDGDTERGTSGNPFNTVFESTFAVPSSGEVRIAPGSYNEQFRLWRPMRLTRWGNSGVVRIGD